MSKNIDQSRKLPAKNTPVLLGMMRVSVNAQRDLRPARVKRIVAEFDLDAFSPPTVSVREGYYWIVDGQHRTEAIKEWLGPGWEKQNIECRVYTGLTEKQEAELFDRLNNQLTVAGLDKFKVRVTAGRPVETSVQKIVERQGLKVGPGQTAGNVGAVSTLVRVYERAGGAVLTRSLAVSHGSFGDPGMTASMIDGMALVCERYNGALQDDKATEKLSGLRGGLGAVMSRADVLKKQTRRPIAQCVAAAVVDILNTSRGGHKLPSWWAQ